MARHRLLATGTIGFIVSMLGCMAQVLVVLLTAVGISGSAGWLDYILPPAVTVFAALIVCALLSRRRRQRMSLNSTSARQ